MIPQNKMDKKKNEEDFIFSNCKVFDVSHCQHIF